MLDRLREPVVRGFVLAAIASAAFGFAMNAQQNIVSNFFEHELGLQGSEFGYITAIREIPGFLLIFLTALFYRVSLPRLTAGALCLLAIGVLAARFLKSTTPRPRYDGPSGQYRNPYESSYYNPPAPTPPYYPTA